MGWIDDQDFMDLDEQEDDNPPRETRCRDCKSEDVYWAQNSTGQWVLYNLNSRRHVCKSNILSSIRLDAFDDLE